MWGGSCDGGDVIVEHVDLPEMRLGDSLVFPDMGAYTRALTSGFNGLPQPTCRYYKKGELSEWVMNMASIEGNMVICKASLLGTIARVSGHRDRQWLILL